MNQSDLCPRDGGVLSERKVEHTRRIGETTFSGRLPALVCRSCKESFIAQSDLADFDARVALMLAGAGMAGPEVLRFLRKATGLQAKEFAQLLGVRPETVSRWEAGKAPMDRATLAIIRQILADRLEVRTGMAEFLRSLQKPKKLPAQVRVRRSS